MKKASVIMVALLTMASAATAQNTLAVADATLPQNGGVLSVTLTMAEENTYSAYQFKVETPEGIAYVTDSENDVECVLDSNHDNTHQVTAHWNATTRLLGVGVISTKTALLKGTTVEIGIPLLPTEAEVGAKFNLTFTGITFIHQTGVKDVLDDVVVAITIGEPTENRVLLDENSTTAPVASDGAVNVRVKRTITAGLWNTICLPFAMTAAQVEEAFGSDVELADFTGVETEEDEDENIVGLTVNFVDASEIEANHPYIIKVSKAVTEFTVDGVTVEPEEEPSVDCDAYTVGKGKAAVTFYNRFVGTYVAQTELPAMTLFIADNKFYYSTGQTKMKAFRGYFDFYDVLTDVENEYAEVKMAFNVDGIATRIENSKLKIENSTGAMYDLSGRRVEKPAQKGVYIVKGKKVSVK